MRHLAPTTIEVGASAGVVRIAMNRPDVHNAFNEALLKELTEEVKDAGSDPDVRVIVLTGNGKSFCAGADLNWMKSVLSYTVEQNKKDAGLVVDLLDTIDNCPKPVVGRINGAAIGGGVGLVAVCDIAVASTDARFAFGEAKLGIIPAMISPYVLRKVTSASAREFFLTGERFDAQVAKEIGLINNFVPPDKLDEAVNAKVTLLLTSGPNAVAEAKKLLRTVPTVEADRMKDYTTQLIAELRASPEGQEGMKAFLEKRKPKWVK